MTHIGPIKPTSQRQQPDPLGKAPDPVTGARYERLAVITWLWRDPRCRTRYTADHVNAWARMVKRNLDQPARVVCLTDDSDGIEECEALPLPEDFAAVQTKAWPARMGYPQCYRRLAMHRGDFGEWLGADRVLSMDLDVCIRGSLGPLLDRAEPIVFAPGTGARRPYNGSLLLFTPGARPQLYEDFTAGEAEAASRKYLGSDQAWYVYKLGANEARFGEAEGVRHYDRALAQRVNNGRGLGSDPRLIFFTGRAKPWQISHPDIAEHYG